MMAYIMQLKIVCGFIAAIILGLVTCPLQGQVLPQKKLLPSDYHLWGTLQPEAISATGKWVSYYVTRETGQDTLFVQGTASGAKFAFPGASAGKFSGDSNFSFSVPGKGIGVLEMATGRLVVIPAAESGDFSANGRFLVTCDQLGGHGKGLVIRDNKGAARDTIHNVAEYRWDNSKNAILYSVRSAKDSKVSLVRLQQKASITSICDAVGMDFHTLQWSNDDKRIAFYGDPEELSPMQNMLLYYDLGNKRLFKLTPSAISNFPQGLVIGKDLFRSLVIADDGQKVFFGLKGLNDHTARPEHVEIWNGNDKKLYPEARDDDEEAFYELAVWWPMQGKVKQITSHDFPFVMLAGNQDFALTGSSSNYDPQYKGVSDMDLCLTHLPSGESKRLLKRQSVALSQIRTSPDGRFIFYYKDSGWWAYCVYGEKHINLTASISFSLDRTESDPGNQFEVYGLGGYTKDGKVLLYDQYDIWAVSMDGKVPQRMTKGRGSNIQYRILPEQEWHIPYNFSGASLEIVDPSKPVWLRTLDLDSNTPGYSLLTVSSGKVKPVTPGYSASRLLRAKHSLAYLFINQRFDIPPQVIYGAGTGKHSLIVQSNPHHFKYSWGRSRLIQFENRNKEELKAALYYPANYDAAKKYPMIVYIYDIVSRDVNTYVNPTLQNPYGFNIANLTSNGYFVLLPDIRYEKGKTGFSAVDCVESAVRAALSAADIDAGAIGLLGHSFGGFETNYIVSHSNMFSAAVSGSAVSDVVSAYLTVHTDAKTADLWRYEKQQYRLGSTLYDSTEVYLKNSPVLAAAGINTPLLLFAGKADTNVRHEQSIEMYLALRRLGKQTILLLYPDEGHILFRPESQADLTLRIEAWFDYFLKKDRSHAWIKNGVE